MNRFILSMGSVLALSVSPIEAAAKTVIVETAAELELAVRTASPDDVIRLRPGVYELTSRSSPQLRLPVGVDLVGPSNELAIVKRAFENSNEHKASGSILALSGGHTRIRHIHFVGVAGALGKRETAIVIGVSSTTLGNPIRAHVDHCVFEHFGTAIRASGSVNRLFVRSTRFRKNGVSIWSSIETDVRYSQFLGSAGEKGVVSVLNSSVRLQSNLFYEADGSFGFFPWDPSDANLTLVNNIVHQGTP